MQFQSYFNGKPFSLSLPRKSVVRITDRLDMVIAIDWKVKPNKVIFMEIESNIRSPVLLN